MNLSSPSINNDDFYSVSKSSNFNPIIIFGKYKLLHHLGIGSFGDVYSGEDIKTHKKVALKFEKLNFGQQLLQNETYSLVNNKGRGIPQVLSFGIYHNQYVLVQEILGKNLEEIFSSCNRNFPIKDLCMIMIQIIERLEHIHKKGYIHRDIKPTNFALGHSDNSTENIIYLLDFGIAKKYRSSRTKRHVKFKLTGKLNGSVSFVSRWGFMGAEQSRRDDLLSLAYILIYFIKGELPWKNEAAMPLNRENFKRIFTLKQSLDENKILKGYPNEFIKFVNYTKKLKFQENPDYSYMKNLFLSVLSMNDFTYDLNFSWNNEIIGNLKEKHKKSNSRNTKKSFRERLFKCICSRSEISLNENNDLINNKKKFEEKTHKITISSTV